MTFSNNPINLSIVDKLPENIFFCIDEIPPGQFHGGDEIPAGTFH